MVTIDWKEYKAYKAHSHKEDRLAILVDFLRSYYNMNNPNDIFDAIVKDDTGQMLLERKDISTVESFESFMLR